MDYIPKWLKTPEVKLCIRLTIFQIISVEQLFAVDSTQIRKYMRKYLQSRIEVLIQYAYSSNNLT